MKHFKKSVLLKVLVVLFVSVNVHKLIEEIDTLPHQEHMKYEQDRMATSASPT